MPDSLGGAGEDDGLQKAPTLWGLFQNAHRPGTFSMESGRNAGGVTMERGGGHSAAFEGE